jgi:hypothetical protein
MLDRMGAKTAIAENHALQGENARKNQINPTYCFCLHSNFVDGKIREMT